MAEDWLQRWFTQMFGSPYGYSTYRKSFTLTQDQINTLRDILNKVEEPKYENNVFGNWESIFESWNPENLFSDFFENLKVYIDDMEENSQMEADMTIKRNGKTYLVNIKTVPSMETDDDEDPSENQSEEEDYQSDESEEESEETDSA